MDLNSNKINVGEIKKNGQEKKSPVTVKERARESVNSEQIEKKEE